MNDGIFVRDGIPSAYGLCALKVEGRAIDGAFVGALMLAGNDFMRLDAPYCAYGGLVDKDNGGGAYQSPFGSRFFDVMVIGTASNAHPDSRFTAVAVFPERLAFDVALYTSGLRSDMDGSFCGFIDPKGFMDAYGAMGIDFKPADGELEGFVERYNSDVLCSYNSENAGTSAIGMLTREDLDLVRELYLNDARFREDVTLSRMDGIYDNDGRYSDVGLWVHYASWRYGVEFGSHALADVGDATGFAGVDI